MPTKPPTFKPANAASRSTMQRLYDAKRGSARARGYTTQWDKAAKAFIAEHPLCQYCEADQRLTPSTLVDHLYPQRTFDGVMWRSEWWVACCDACHSGFKQIVERDGRVALDALARRLGRPTLAEG